MHFLQCYIFSAEDNSKFFKVLGVNCKKVQLFERAAVQRYTLGKSYLSCGCKMKSSVFTLVFRKGSRITRLVQYVMRIKRSALLGISSGTRPLHTSLRPLPTGTPAVQSGTWRSTRVWAYGRDRGWLVFHSGILQFSDSTPGNSLWPVTISYFFIAVLPLALLAFTVAD